MNWTNPKLIAKASEIADINGWTSFSVYKNNEATARTRFSFAKLFCVLLTRVKSIDENGNDVWK